jgi:hypothetical protein
MLSLHSKRWVKIIRTLVLLCFCHAVSVFSSKILIAAWTVMKSSMFKNYFILIL